MDKKDYFSGHSGIYAAFRPTYPESLYKFIFQHVKGRVCAWDCATGNGQVATYLAAHFESVYATDISQQQLDHAFRRENIFYSAAPAEHTGFSKEQFDLITVAQALHWFNRSEFYTEVRRTLKPGGLLAVWGYALLTVEPAIDSLFMDFYTNKTGPYWDAARRLVENYYRDIDFPFDQIASPEFRMTFHWSLEQFTGYLTSWSATQKFIRAHGVNPVDALAKELQSIWKPEQVKAVSFPLFARLGRIKSL